MKQRFLDVMDELTITRAELLEQIDRIARRSPGKKTISRTTLYNIIYRNDGLSERSATLILEAINFIAKKKGHSRYDYPDVDLVVSRCIRHRQPFTICRDCGYAFITLNLYNRHFADDGCKSAECMKSKGWICSEHVVRISSTSTNIVVPVWSSVEYLPIG